jgi:hypothetical protein
MLTDKSKLTKVHYYYTYTNGQNLCAKRLFYIIISLVAIKKLVKVQTNYSYFHIKRNVSFE